MIETLFSLLLVPLMPALGDPFVNHAAALAAVERTLQQGRNVQSAAPNVDAVASELPLLTDTPESLPLITGRLFAWSNVQRSEEQALGDELGITTEALRLTGLIESSGQRVAILNDGQRDHVVGVGSYVLNAYRVNALNSDHVVLLPVDGWTKGKRLELKLMPGATPGGL